VYNRNKTYVHLESSVGHTSIKVDKIAHYLPHEELLADKRNPQKWTGITSLQLSDSFLAIEDEDLELWGWNFVNDDRQVIVSVLSGSRKRFSQKDINFLKLVADNLETKLLELCLIKELDEKNHIISQINEDQKEIITERTSEIAVKNKTLLEISVLNAHSVREPLSRILGLVSLLDAESEEDLYKEIIPMIKNSSNDLDKALQNVIDHTTKDLLELKVKNEKNNVSG